MWSFLGRLSLAAFIRLHRPLLDNVMNAIVYPRSHHRVWRSYSVSVVPWPERPPTDDQVNDIDIRKRVVCLAEMKTTFV